MSDGWEKYWKDHPDKYKKMDRQFNRVIYGYLLLIVVLFVVTILLVFAVRAQAHTAAELDEWTGVWVVEADTSLNGALTDEWTDMADRHPYYFDPQPPPPHKAHRGIGTGVEQWRSLVLAYFGPERVDTALCIMSYESGGNPNAQNPRSSAAGLFQIVEFWWDKYGGDRYDPVTNVALAHVIYDQQGWTAWNPYKRGLCR